MLWSISICLGALQNNIHAELAAMFPNKSGGIALYAHEAWRKYLTPIGPLATFGYWIGWSVVLSINGLVAGTLIQARVVLRVDVGTRRAPASTSRCRSCIGIGLIVLVWLFNVYGVRPAVWFAYVTGGLLMIPAFVLMFLPYITGDWSSSNMQWDIGANGGLAARDRVAVLHVLVVLRDGGRGDVRARVPRHREGHDEGAALAPRCSARGLRAAAARPGRHAGDGGDRRRTTAIAYYTTAFDELVGNALANVMIVCVVGRARPVDEHGDHGRLAEPCTASRRTG